MPISSSKQAYVASGNNIEHAWLPPNLSADEPVVDFKYEEVRSPPPSEREEFTLEPTDTHHYNSPEKSPIEVGEYCVVVLGEVIYSSNSIEDVELYIEDLIIGDSDNSLKKQDLMVFKRLPVKIGVSVKV